MNSPNPQASDIRLNDQAGPVAAAAGTGKNWRLRQELRKYLDDPGRYEMTVADVKEPHPPEVQ